MEATHRAFPLSHLIILDASGRLDLAASRNALKDLASDPEFDAKTEVLLDLRDVDCDMSTVDIYDLATYMAWPNPVLPTQKKIAILVAGRTEFDHAKFLEMCVRNRGPRVAAFLDYDQADDWLNAELPEDPKTAN